MIINKLLVCAVGLVSRVSSSVPFLTALTVVLGDIYQSLSVCLSVFEELRVKGAWRIAKRSKPSDYSRVKLVNSSGPRASRDPLPLLEVELTSWCLPLDAESWRKACPFSYEKVRKLGLRGLTEILVACIVRVLISPSGRLYPIISGSLVGDRAKPRFYSRLLTREFYAT